MVCTCTINDNHFAFTHTFSVAFEKPQTLEMQSTTTIITERLENIGSYIPTPVQAVQVCAYTHVYSKWPTH